MIVKTRPSTTKSFEVSFASTQFLKTTTPTLKMASDDFSTMPSPSLQGLVLSSATLNGGSSLSSSMNYIVDGHTTTSLVSPLSSLANLVPNAGN